MSVGSYSTTGLSSVATNLGFPAIQETSEIYLLMPDAFEETDQLRHAALAGGLRAERIFRAL